MILLCMTEMKVIIMRLILVKFRLLCQKFFFIIITVCFGREKVVSAFLMGFFLLQIQKIRVGQEKQLE